jgi:hypothetical protein
MAKKIKIGKKTIAVLVTITVFLAISGLHLLGVFRFLEYKSYDLRVNLLANVNRRVSDDITVVLLTQDCLDWAKQERNWGWPWPREAYAEFLDYMNLGNAKSVAFDVLFTEPSIYRNARQDEIIDGMVSTLERVETLIAQNEGQRRGAGTGSLLMQITNDLQSIRNREDDASFVRAATEFNRMVQAVFFSTQTGSAESWPAGIDAPLFQTENFGTMQKKFDKIGRAHV